MINIWKFSDSDQIRIIDIDNRIFEGKVIDITDAGEESEDYGFGEDSITISSNGQHIVFPQSEIKSIQEI